MKYDFPSKELEEYYNLRESGMTHDGALDVMNGRFKSKNS